MIVDSHTDVLWKMLNNNEINFYNDSTNELSVNYKNMVIGNVDIQVFAIFVSQYTNSKFTYALKSVDDFYQKIILADRLELATNFKEIENILKKGSKVALLSLEGADAIEGDLYKLRIFYQLGVRAIGLTWNYANEVADGILEERNGALTNFGRKFINQINELGMIIDVSHLSERGFWEVIELSKKSIIASHSNAKRICNHVRNLSDEQIKAIISNGGIISTTFVKNFVMDKPEPSIDDLLLHIDHIAGLGGITNIGLGSDFDGANTIKGLENASQYSNLINALHKNYSNNDVQAIMGGNLLNYYKRIL